MHEFMPILSRAVEYSNKDFSFGRTGELQEISDSSIRVNGRYIRIEDIRTIGHTKKGIYMFLYGTGIITGFTLGYIVLNDNNTAAERMTGLAISLPLMAFSEIVAWKNRAYRVSKKYTFKVST